MMNSGNSQGIVKIAHHDDDEREEWRCKEAHVIFLVAGATRASLVRVHDGPDYTVPSSSQHVPSFLLRAPRVRRLHDGPDYTVPSSRYVKLSTLSSSQQRPSFLLRAPRVRRLHDGPAVSW